MQSERHTKPGRNYCLPGTSYVGLIRQRSHHHQRTTAEALAPPIRRQPGPYDRHPPLRGVFSWKFSVFSSWTPQLLQSKRSLIFGRRPITTPSRRGGRGVNKNSGRSSKSFLLRPRPPGGSASQPTPTSPNNEPEALPLQARCEWRGRRHDVELAEHDAGGCGAEQKAERSEGPGRRPATKEHHWRNDLTNGKQILLDCAPPRL